MLEAIFDNFHWYGFLIAISILTCQWLAKKLTTDKDLKTLIDDALLPAVFGGLIGARLYHVFDLWDYYSQRPLEIFALNQGGLGIYGALVGGAVGLYLYLHFTKRKKYLIDLLNVVAATLPLGQAIGRIGNYINKELFGTITNLPWGIKDASGVVRHPLFFYESVLNLILFGVLLSIFKKNQSLSLPFYLIGYGSIRILLSPFREGSDTWKLGNIDIALITSLTMIIIGLLISKKEKNKQTGNGYHS